MSPDFLKAVNRTLGSEGGYSFNPSDPGGETNWGITARTARANGFVGEMRFLTREQAIEIYEKVYWMPIRGDDLPFSISYQLFDAAVNSGPVQAVRWLQKSLYLPEDGVFGPATLPAVKNHASNESQRELGVNFILERSDFQTNLPTWPAFGKGWVRRNNQNTRYLMKDTNEA